MTSPYSIYILIGLTYPDYKAEKFATYIDSESRRVNVATYFKLKRCFDCQDKDLQVATQK